MDFDAKYVLSVAVWNVPVLAIGVVGIVLALVRPLPGRARGLLIGGSATIVLSTLLSMAFSLALPSLYDEIDDIDQYARIYLVVGLVLGATQMIGMGLLIAAALANRAPAGVSPPPYAPGYGASPAQWTPPDAHPGQWAPPDAPPANWGPPGSLR